MASLSALDLLSVSDAEQAILRCLNRQPQLLAPDIKAVTGLASDELETTLSQMVQKGLLVEQLVSEQRKFSVRFGRESTAHVRNLPRNLLAVFEQTDDRFLDEIPLAAALSPEDRAAVL